MTDITLQETEAQLREMEDSMRLEALVKIRNLIRAFELTPVDLATYTDIKVPQPAM